MYMFRNITTGEIEAACRHHIFLFPQEGTLTEEQKHHGQEEFAPCHGPVEEGERCWACWAEQREITDDLRAAGLV